MASLDLCPQCGGKLVPVGERTGGFSGTKAVVGAVLVGPMGVAAGATGKKLVTLQCVKCGYTIETDEKTAREAAEFGEAFERYCNFHASKIPQPGLIHSYGYSEKEIREFRVKGYANRTEERKKIGVDIEQVEKEVEKLGDSFDKEDQKRLEEIRALKQKQEEERQRLQSLGFFKFSEKKTAQAEIQSLEEQIGAARGKRKEEYNKFCKEAARMRGEYVERCRVLAYAALEDYCPEEYREFFRCVISMLSGEPKDARAILDPLNSDMTNLQFGLRMSSVANPFISTSTIAGKKVWYLGPDSSEDRGQERFIMSLQKRPEEQTEPVTEDDSLLGKEGWAAQRRQNGAIAVGYNHIVALRADGTVVAAGKDSGKACEVADWKDIVSVAAEMSTTYGVRADGEVMVAGFCIDEEEFHRVFTDIVQISAGGNHILGLKRDGTVVSMTPMPEFGNEDGESEVSDWSDMAEVQAGSFISMGLRRDGTVRVMGNNQYSALEANDWSQVEAILGATNYALYGIRADGTLLTTDRFTKNQKTEDCVGISGTKGKLDTLYILKSDGTLSVRKDTTEQKDPDEDWKNLVAVADGDQIRVGLRENGTLVVAGEEVPEEVRKAVETWTGLYVDQDLLERKRRCLQEQKERKARKEQKEKEKKDLQKNEAAKEKNRWKKEEERRKRQKEE